MRASRLPLHRGAENAHQSRGKKQGSREPHPVAFVHVYIYCFSAASRYLSLSLTVLILIRSASSLLRGSRGRSRAVLGFIHSASLTQGSRECAQYTHGKADKDPHSLFASKGRKNPAPLVNKGSQGSLSVAAAFGSALFTLHKRAMRVLCKLRGAHS